MSKKLLWLLAALVATLALVAAGCGSDDEEGAATTPAATGDTAAAEAISVGLVTDIGGLNDRGFNELANTGLARPVFASSLNPRSFRPPMSVTRPTLIASAAAVSPVAAGVVAAPSSSSLPQPAATRASVATSAASSHRSFLLKKCLLYPVR